MNKYQQDPEEFRRVVGIITAGMEWREIVYFLRKLTYQLGVALNIKTRGRTSATVAFNIHQELSKFVPDEPHYGVVTGTGPQNSEPPPEPEPEPEPDPEPAPDLTEGQTPCDGCGGMSGPDGETLRWVKVDDGEAITYSVNWAGAPSVPGFDDAVIDRLFARWSGICDIKFERVSAQEVGDIDITFGYIDGPGNTLGIAWQPRGSFEDMAVAGDLSGDIKIDNSERWFTNPDALLHTLLHEIGHAIGMPHLDSPRDVMYFAVTSVLPIDFSTADKLEALKKYPKAIQA